MNGESTIGAPRFSRGARAEARPHDPAIRARAEDDRVGQRQPRLGRRRPIEHGAGSGERDVVVVGVLHRRPGPVAGRLEAGRGRRRRRGPRRRGRRRGGRTAARSSRQAASAAASGGRRAEDVGGRRRRRRPLRRRPSSRRRRPGSACVVVGAVVVGGVLSSPRLRLSRVVAGGIAGGRPRSSRSLRSETSRVTSGPPEASWSTASVTTPAPTSVSAATNGSRSRLLGSAGGGAARASGRLARSGAGPVPGRRSDAHGHRSRDRRLAAARFEPAHLALDPAEPRVEPLPAGRDQIDQDGEVVDPLAALVVRLAPEVAHGLRQLARGPS